MAMPLSHCQSASFAEFHLDFMVQQFLAKTFALGFQSYYYNQGSDDSGSGALFGDFQGESVGVGLTVALAARVWQRQTQRGRQMAA